MSTVNNDDDDECDPVIIIMVTIDNKVLTVQVTVNVMVALHYCVISNTE